MRIVSCTSSDATVSFDRLEKQAEAQGIEKCACLLHIGPIAEVEDKRLESARIHAQLEHHVIGRQKDASAVDAAREAYPDRLMLRNRIQPLADLFSQRSDILTPDHVEVRRQCPHRRREEPRVNRIWIGASDELNLHHVVCRHHARVARMKLAVKSFLAEPGVNFVNARRNDQHWPGLLLGKEVPHRPVQRSRHAHGLALVGDQRKRSRNAADRLRRTVQQALPCLFQALAEDEIGSRVDEIDNAFDVYVGSHFNLSENSHFLKTDYTRAIGRRPQTMDWDADKRSLCRSATS